LFKNNKESISRLPSLDGRGKGRVKKGLAQHPHPTSPIKGGGEARNFEIVSKPWAAAV
jgi:hypothetical protein